MQLGGELDVEFLLDSRQQVHELLSTSPRGGLVGPGMVTLSLLSSRDEIWEVHVLAVGVATSQGTNPWQVIEGFATGDLGSIREHLAINLPADAIEALELSAQFLRYAFTWDAVAAAAVSTPLLEYCLKQDGSRQEILECLRRG